MRRRSSTTAYALAVSSIVLALIVRFAVDPWMHQGSVFLFFAPAVMLAAWYGGFGPGVVATLLGAVLGNVFLLGSAGSLAFSSEEIGRVIVFVLVGLQISWLSGAMLDAQRRAEHDATLARTSERLLQDAHDNLDRRVRDRTAELHFQKTLLESQNQASSDGILAVSDDGRIIFANHRFNEMWQVEIPTNYPRALGELRGMMGRLLDPPVQDPLLVESSTDTEIGAAVETEASDELTLRDDRTIERYSAPIIDPDGKSYGRVWFFRDITERKRLQRQILEAAEVERCRIGQDLHDDLCQQLTGIACIGRALQQKLKGRGEPTGGGNRDQDDAAAAMEIVRMVQHAN